MSFLYSAFQNFCFYTIFACVLTFLVTFVIWLSLLIFYYDIHVGEPSIRALHLAYKYSYLKRSSSLCFKQLCKQYPDYKLVKLCYCGPKSYHIEYANGIIVSEIDLKPDVYMLENLLKNGLSLFKTPSISHALTLSFPVVPWIPIMKLVAVAIAYPRLFRYVKEHGLCAYPVMEVYSKSSVTIMVPLLRQDEFVVKEAERLVHGRQFSAMLSPIVISPYFNKITNKKTKLNSSPRVTKGERKG